MTRRAADLAAACRPLRRPLVALLAVAAGSLAAVAVGSSPARANPSQEAIFQDDSLLVYPPAAQVAATLDTLQSLGVDRIRVTVGWRLIAPDPSSNTRPSFNAADPGAYPAANWDRYDTVVQLARARGIGVDLNLSGPAPSWATGHPADSSIEQTYYPNASNFGQWVRAVATRYSGSYVPPPTPAPKPGGGGGGGGGLPPLPIPLPGLGSTNSVPSVPTTTSAAPAAATPRGTAAHAAAISRAPLPRVDYWSIWNEPNQSHFLTPQWDSANGRAVETSPRVYRGLVDEGVAALGATGHAQDTILIGETAPGGDDNRTARGLMKTLRFVRRLYCVDDRLRPLSGSYAAAEGCPTSDQRRRMLADHPGLFYATGFAHHPYSLIDPPWRHGPADFVMIADLGRLTGTLARTFHAYGLGGAGLPIYLTEFGYQSRPPDPFGFAPGTQAAYINEGELMAYASSRVRSTAQFLLEDAAPDSSYPPGSFRYWGTFQTGLETQDGRPKLAFAAYRMPIFLPRTRRPRPGGFRVWGDVRPAANGSRPRVDIQFQPRGGRFAAIATVHTTNSHGYLDTVVNIRRSGKLRLAWRDPATRATLHSRSVSVTVG